MAEGNGNGLSPLLESHENRLVGMEDKLDKVSDRLAVTEVKIDVIDHGVCQINSKLDSIMKPIQDLGGKVVSLEAYRSHQLNKSAWTRKVLTALLIAACGALIKLVFDALT